MSFKKKKSFSLQLRDNIEKFFTWFVEEGKATVRLKEPAVDICLSKVWRHTHYGLENMRVCFRNFVS